MIYFWPSLHFSLPCVPLSRLDELRLKLEGQGLDNVTYMVVNHQGEQAQRLHTLLRQKLSENITLYKQQPKQEDVWQTLAGEKDDFLIYDRSAPDCGLCLSAVSLLRNPNRAHHAVCSPNNYPSLALFSLSLTQMWSSDLPYLPALLHPGYSLCRERHQGDLLHTSLWGLHV